jgi:hypothetical protein
MTSVTASAMARVAYEARRLYSAELGQAQPISWEDAPLEERRQALLGVQAVLSGTARSGAHLHDAWSRHGLEAPPHPLIAPGYEQLPITERRKVLLFRAVILALVDGPCNGYCHDEKCPDLSDHICHLDTCVSRFGVPPGLWRPQTSGGGDGGARLGLYC